jgi:hypothetical protein
MVQVMVQQAISNWGATNMSDNQFVRPAGKVIQLTDEQIEEVLKCADPDTGYEYFMTRYFYIQHPTKGQMLYNPYDYQVDLIKNYHENRFSISMLARQMGKTTSAAGYLLWFAMFSYDKTILIAAHQYSGAQEIMQRIRYAYEMCPMWLKPGAEAYNQGNIDFENKSRIIARATTEKTGRGMSLSLLYLDEFAFLRPSIAKEFWTAISPTLATGGKCIITSTPNSDEDQFARIWRDANKRVDAYGNQTKLGRNGFSAYKALWNQHPDRDERWAEEERSKIGDERFRREHNCEFIIDEETLIDSIVLSELEGTDPIYKSGQVRWYKKPTKGHIYVTALDPSLGTGGDAAAIQVFEADTTEQVAEWRHNRTPIPEQIKLLAAINKEIVENTKEPNNLYYSLENNTIGEAALISLAEYGEENIQGIMVSEPKSIGNVRRYRRGFNTTNKSKLSACSKFKNLLESKKLKIRSSMLISELKTFVASGGSYAAKIGETDDLVMSSLLVVRIFQHLQNFHVDLDQHIRDHSEEIEPMPFVMVMG